MPRQRYHVEARDVPPIAAARILGMTEEAFTKKLAELVVRGFPAPDPTTGNFDKKAIDRWQDLRHPGLFGIEAANAAPLSDIRERLRTLATSNDAELRNKRTTKRERDALEFCFRSRPNSANLSHCQLRVTRWLTLHGLIEEDEAIIII